jgi:hypothetical protein
MHNYHEDMVDIYAFIAEQITELRNLEHFSNSKIVPILTFSPQSNHFQLGVSQYSTALQSYLTLV